MKLLIFMEHFHQNTIGSDICIGAKNTFFSKLVQLFSTHLICTPDLRGPVVTRWLLHRRTRPNYKLTRLKERYK